MNSSCSEIDIEVVRQQLDQPSRSLGFPAALECEFANELRSTEQRSALFTSFFLMLLWAAYLGLDSWRWQFIRGGEYAEEFLLGVAMPRVLVMLCFAWVVWLLSRASTPLQQRNVWMAILVLACSSGIVMTSYTLRNVGLHETSSVLLLTVVVALYPLGVPLRQMLPVAAAVCLICGLAGPFMLKKPADMLTHWVTMGSMVVTLFLSAVTAYYRERAKREQFLLRKLLKWEAGHDPLTGLGNRRLFNDQFQRYMGHTRREQQQQLFLAIIDIDHFKLYNDHYGHQAGDEVLRKVAKVLRGHLRRPLDLAVRLGGEEFAVLVHSDNAQGCSSYIQGMVNAFRDLNIPHAASPTAAYVSVSIGLAQMHDGDSMDSMFSRADKLLYNAKQQGRNRLCMEPTAQPRSRLSV
ncbi:sensor domain-containing diguanylate cyclase [Pseudomonas sp. 5P_3.1_Bac2]|uniref:GGDEF domain-containing protein n=1 Tax=Pseudomonas sp. 5P_3.1_Bac2 TaxID=2971617 RepID=UPI0021CAA0C2|nr:GGDEF domain-containing protein [Pseudomonas sp. 5P_3.1_Bac2]MCU1717839.1 GGDEF domain-containing protein [Pseudomonas sp. 5P_3.1_Bac2]